MFRMTLLDRKRDYYALLSAYAQRPCREFACAVRFAARKLAEHEQAVGIVPVKEFQDLQVEAKP